MFIVAVFAVLFAGACSGNGGSGGGLNFQEGLPPEDVSGTFEITATITNNSCGEGVDVSGTSTMALDQDGTDVTMQDESGNDDGSGVVSGSSFRIEEITSGEVGGGCTATLNGTMVGTVDGDEISGAAVISANYEGSCPSSAKNCSVSANFTGNRVPSTHITVPAGQTPVETEPVEGGGTAAIPPEDTIPADEGSSPSGASAEKAQRTPTGKGSLWFLEVK